MSLDTTVANPFYQLLVSLVLGLIVGLQREWADSPLGGIRTFSLIALLGTTCALLAERHGGWIIAVGFAGTIAAMVVGDIAKMQKIDPQKHSGLVTEFAMLLMFAIGVLVHHDPLWLAAALAGGLAVILQAKPELHGFVARFSTKEIRAIMQFLLISLVILPIVPNRTFGPLDVFNPHEAWLMVVLIVAISLAGYISYKFFGEKAGVLLGGILGGVISSTATTLTYAKRKGDSGKNLSQAALLILIAWTVLYCRVFLASFVAAPQFQAVLAPLGIMFTVSAAATLWLWRNAEKHQKGMPPQDNPTEIKTALTFAVLYSIVLFAVAFAKQNFGHAGLTAVAILSGLTDMDAITLSTARLVANGKLQQAEAWPLIVISIISNTIFKSGLVLAFGGRELFRPLAMPILATIATGIGLLVLW
ncbi:MAG: DUF4010 domain-containing protein [bacterium]|nr:DUF4010 domain-containing protein [bacterium]